MYSWGYSDTSTWKNPGEYDYGDAKKGYLKSLEAKAEEEGPREYDSKKMPDLKLVDPMGRTISTNSANPVVFLIDGTGSMQKRPKEIFDRLPLAYQTLVKYRDDVAMSMCVVGDHRFDKWSAQINDFGDGVTLDKMLNGLHAEGGGGPGINESYEQSAYFMLNHCNIPNATSPFLFVMGDEKFYDVIQPETVKKLFGDTIQGPVDSYAVWNALAQKFDIYFLRKPLPPYDKQVIEQWAKAIGKEKIVDVYDDDRVVDFALGIVAKKWGQVGDFKKSLLARQDSKTAEKVLDSIRAADVISGKKSLLKLPKGNSVKLLEED